MWKGHELEEMVVFSEKLATVDAVRHCLDNLFRMKAQAWAPCLLYGNSEGPLKLQCYPWDQMKLWI